MKHIPRDDILQVGLSLLKNMGERMNSRSKALRLFRTFNLVVLVANLFFILANLSHVEGAGYIKTTECAVTICHAIFKYSLFIYYKSDIEKLLDDVQHFWNFKRFETQLRTRIKILYRNIKYSQVYYLATGLSCIVMYFLKPVINTNNRFLFECWTFRHSLELDTLVLACQYYFWIILLSVVLGYDSLYFAYCVHIVVQLRLLNHRFETMPRDITIGEIGEYIRHHQMVLSRFLKTEASEKVDSMISETLSKILITQHTKAISTTDYGRKSLHSTMFAIFKYSLFIYYKSDIEKLLDDIQLFWNIKQFGRQLCSRIKILYRNIKYSQVYYLATGLSCIAMYFLKPVINKNNRFLFECWTFTHSFELETLVLACQYYFWIVLFPVVFGYDSLYFSYCVHIIVQLRLLNHRFGVMPGDVTIDEIGEYIRHHQMILSIFARMKTVYFWMLLFHYFVTLITGCSQLYVILLGTTDKADLIATVIYISGLLVQFAYYSFPVEEIVFELKNLSNSIYISSWYEKDLTVQRVLLFVMTRAQRQKYLSAGGIIDINIDAFGSVVRKAFSFYAILRNVISK